MQKNQMTHTMLSGWGGYPKASPTNILRPDDTDEIALTDTPLIARGLGRSYGDAAMNSEQTILSTERLNRFLAFDLKNGILKAESGVSFEEILNVIVPKGWFLPVTPGTKFVTLGGAISADVHGKNHHKEGSLGAHVLDLSMRLADGQVISCSKTENTSLFHAAIGGFGLLGLIEEATIQLKKIETASIKQQTFCSKNLEETLQLLKEHDQTTYSVAWIDCLASKERLGRGVLLLGEHAKAEELPTQKQKPAKVYELPKFWPIKLTPFKVKLFNQIYYSSHKNPKNPSYIDFDRYFYPLDAILGWNRIYGKTGFLQFQCVLPMKNYEEGLKTLLKTVSESQSASFLAVLKRFGPKGSSLLSFPIEGYTLALDLPYSPETLKLVERLNAITCDYQGRVYLAKDACLTPGQFLLMYPEYQDWKKIKESYDPKGIWSSDLSRRLMEIKR